LDSASEKLTVALFDAILDFMLSKPTVEQIVTFRLPTHLEDRVHTLFEHNRTGRLSANEKAELDELLRIDHFFTMLKVRARNKQRNMKS
jgi:hypothetical protein